MTQPIETCYEWVDEIHDHCNEPAEFILWGELFDADALGPRCYDHAVKRIGWSGMGRIDQWAVFDLRKVIRR